MLVIIIFGGFALGLVIALLSLYKKLVKLKAEFKVTLQDVLGSIDTLILTDFSNTIILTDAVISKGYITGFVDGQLTKIRAEAEYPIGEYVATTRMGDGIVAFLFGTIQSQSREKVFKPMIKREDVRAIISLNDLFKTFAKYITESSESTLGIVRESLNTAKAIRKMLSANLTDIMKLVGGIIAIDRSYVKAIQEGYKLVTGQKKFSYEEMMEILFAGYEEEKRGKK